MAFKIRKIKMTIALYLKDHYKKDFEAQVIKAEGRFVILDQTCFFPSSGGQPEDHGTIHRKGTVFDVIFVRKIGEDIFHEVDSEGLQAGDKVKGNIDWDRRYQLMRAHTAAHIISEIIHKETKALITGNQLGLDHIRIDFSLKSFNKEKIKEYIEKANEIIQQDLSITTEFLSRKEAQKQGELSKLAMGLPESLQEIRIVKIGNFDLQADGGTHVKSTKEIGKIEFIKTENKGKNNRRIYFKIE